MAGLIIASFFLEFPVALELFAGPHAIGGFIGGTSGLTLVRAFISRRVTPSHM